MSRASGRITADAFTAIYWIANSGEAACPHLIIIHTLIPSYCGLILSDLAVDFSSDEVYVQIKCLKYHTVIIIITAVD